MRGVRIAIPAARRCDRVAAGRSLSIIFGRPYRHAMLQTGSFSKQLLDYASVCIHKRDLRIPSLIRPDYSPQSHNEHQENQAEQGVAVETPCLSRWQRAPKALEPLAVLDPSLDSHRAAWPKCFCREKAIFSAFFT